MTVYTDPEPCWGRHLHPQLTMPKPKYTPGPWRVACDAQGPNMVMHPTKVGLALASCTDAYVPTHGFHEGEPTDEATPLTEGGDTHWPERVANVRLMAAAPELFEALQDLLELHETEKDRPAVRAAREALELAIHGRKK